MNNFFIAEYFDWEVKRISYLDRLAQRLLRKLGINFNFRSAHLLDQLVTRVIGRSPSHTISGGTTNIEQRINMYHLVSQVLAYGVEGDLVELGCYSGRSSVLIAKIMQFYSSTKKLILFDSFEGLPSLDDVDRTAFFKKGDLATSAETVLNLFKELNLPRPEIHKGWFEDTLPNGLPEKICFAYLDGDLYKSILVSLRNVYPRMTDGAICLIDDYCDLAVSPKGKNLLPGVKIACDEFLQGKPEQVEYIYSGSNSHAFFRKAIRPLI
jgi:O-methyltransferase